MGKKVREGSSSGTCPACQTTVEVFGRNSTPLFTNSAFRNALRGHLLICLGSEEEKEQLRRQLDGFESGGRPEAKG